MYECVGRWGHLCLVRLLLKQHSHTASAVLQFVMLPCHLVRKSVPLLLPVLKICMVSNASCCCCCHHSAGLPVGLCS